MSTLRVHVQYSNVLICSRGKEGVRIKYFEGYCASDKQLSLTVNILLLYYCYIISCPWLVNIIHWIFDFKEFVYFVRLTILQLLLHHLMPMSNVGLEAKPLRIRSQSILCYLSSTREIYIFSGCHISNIITLLFLYLVWCVLQKVEEEDHVEYMPVTLRRWSNFSL